MTGSKGNPPPEEMADVHDAFMRVALEEAEATAGRGNVPVGAVAVHQGQIIAQAGNLRESVQDPTAHAELLALRKAARALGTWRLTDVTLYVTVEPCHMCAGALRMARVSHVVYGAVEPKTGAVESIARLLDGCDVAVESGVRETECAMLMHAFFAELRVRRADARSVRVDDRER